MTIFLLSFRTPAVVLVKSGLRKAFLATLPVLAMATAWGDTSAQTDLASITVTPLTHQSDAKADWQTIYDYEGGAVLPPGTRIASTGKWIAPVVRQDKLGVTFAFPDLPNQPQAAQDLNVAFAVERPFANYPTRTTIHYTSFYNQSRHLASPLWSLFPLTTADSDPKPLSAPLPDVMPAGVDLPVNLTGANTMVFTCGDQGGTTATFNGQDVTSLLGRGNRPINSYMPPPGSMLLSGLAIRNKFTQQPEQKGDWFAVNSMKIEQMRPPLEDSAAAAVDLKVPGTTPICVTVEISNQNNESVGYLLRDALVSPGTYRLYWDGLNQKQSQPKNTPWIDAGTYTFHLTTGKTVVQYAGEINNSTPKYNLETYGLADCTALTLSPPGTTLSPRWDSVVSPDKRKFDTTDSVQMTCISYDARYGMWVGADGTLLHGKIGDNHLQYGRGLAVTPPGPSDPTNPHKQFYFGSRERGASGVFSVSLPARLQNPVAKTLTSPDWNRHSPGFVPFHIRIGQIPYMRGPQHYLFFEMKEVPNNDLSAEWIYRNIRVYEEGDPIPQPLVFDGSKFTVRGRPQAKPLSTPPHGVAIEDDGHSVHVTNSGSVNYPFDYTITPHTILSFDLDVIDTSKIGPGNGLGLDDQPFETFPVNAGRFHNFTTYVDQGRYGFYEPSLGAYNYPRYEPNALYTDAILPPPLGVPLDQLHNNETDLLWQPGFYGLNVSEDGKLLFACNNADNRLEVRDISTDGGLVAKVPINYPMFAALAPEGAAGAPAGTRYIFITSPKEGLVRVAWKLDDNTFSNPVTVTPASKFAYPRGIGYSAVANRIFVCDTFTLDRSKVANQIAVIDPQSGKILSRFGKRGGVDPNMGGIINDGIFTCPLTIAVDSKGALWVNDYYSCEVRKYDFDAASNAFTLERRVLGSNTTNTSHFYWMPGDPPTTVWTTAGFFVRNEAKIDSNGRFTSPRTTSAVYSPTNYDLRPYAHFFKIGGHIYGIFYSEVFERIGDGWVPRFKFGPNAGQAARDAGLLARPGQPPTDLDKAIAASGDKDWQKRPWAWSDLNGNGKLDYSDAKPEFQIAFNSPIQLDGFIPPTGCLRSSDGAFVRTAKGGLLVMPPKTVDGKIFYTWDHATVVPRNDPDPASDVLAQDGHFYVLTISTGRHDMGEKVINRITCYDESGKALWVRDQNDFSLMCLQPLGDGMISIMDRGGWTTEGPVMIRTSDGDLVSQVYCQEPGDCWSNGALRSDADTAYIGIVQAYKVTGLSTVKTATVAADLRAGGP